MDRIYIICFTFLVTLIGIFMYLAIVRKNAFEERLVLFRPTHHLPKKQEVYMKGVRKYRKYANITLMVIFYLPLCVFAVVMLKEGYQQMGRLYIPIPNDTKMLILLVIIPIVAVHYLISYVLKRNEKALRMLVEQMSDSDFDLLLKVKDSLPLSSKYNPPFVLCNKQLYIFIYVAIREIDPAKIIEMNWSIGKKGIFVRLKVPKKIVFTLPYKTFPYFLQIVEQYTNKKYH